MGKYGVKDVFDVQIFQYDENLDDYELVMEVTTASDCEISRDYDKKMNSFAIVDAMVDEKICEDILNGKLNNKYLRIEGVGTWRDGDSIDHRVDLNIGIAKLNKYNLPMSFIEPSKVTFEFDFPTKDHQGKENCVIDIEPKE